MAVNYSTSNAGRNHSIADHQLFDIPNDNWTFLSVYELASSANFGYAFSLGGTYGGLNTAHLYHSSGVPTAKVYTIADTNWGGGALTLNKPFMCYVTRRNGKLYCGGGYVGEPDSFSEGGGSTIASAYSPASGLKIGIRSDLTTNATYALNGKFSDLIYLPGYAFDEAVMTSLLDRPNLVENDWYDKAVLHAYLETSNLASLTDLTGQHAIITNGSGYGTDESFDGRVTRFLRQPSIFIHGALAPVAGSDTTTFNISGSSTTDFQGRTLVERSAALTGASTTDFLGRTDVKRTLTASGSSTTDFQNATTTAAVAFTAVGASSTDFLRRVDVKRTLTAAGASTFSPQSLRDITRTFSITGASEFLPLKVTPARVFTMAGGSTFTALRKVDVKRSFTLTGGSTFSPEKAFPPRPASYSVSYVARQRPVDKEQLGEYTEEEFRQLESVLAVLSKGHVELTYKEPDNLAEGLVRLADGDYWDPGSGKGVYCYYGGAWNKLG